MLWVWIILGGAVCNAYWTSSVKRNVQDVGVLRFTSSLRWGVALLLLPLTWGQWHLFSATWWVGGIVSGILESLGVWTLAQGAKKDYYATFALSNVTPLFVVFLSFWFLHETVTAGLVTGVLLVVVGTLWLYWTGQWSWWGLLSALIGAFSGIASKYVIAESGFAPHACFSFAVGALSMTLWGSQKEGFGLADLGKTVRRNAAPIFGSFLATIGYYLALSLAPYNQVSTLFRFNMVVGFLLSVYWLGEKKRLAPRAMGAILILTGVVLTIWRP